MRVLVAGHVCLHMTPHRRPAPHLPDVQDVGSVSVRPWGPVAETGADLAALGADVALAADVGTDEHGDLLVDLLTGLDLDLSGLRRVPGTTAWTVQDPQGLWHHLGVCRNFTGDHVDLAGVDLLHLGYPSLLPALLEERGAALRRLFARAGDRGVTTSLDLDPVDPESGFDDAEWLDYLAAVLPMTDVVSPSMEDLVTALALPVPLTPAEVLAAAERLVELGAAVAAVTAGPNGLALATAGADRFAVGGRVLAGLGPAWHDRRDWLQIEPLDRRVSVSGAGNGATAGLLYGLMCAADPDWTLACAVDTAARLVAEVRIDPWDPAGPPRLAALPETVAVAGPPPDDGNAEAASDLEESEAAAGTRVLDVLPITGEPASSEAGPKPSPGGPGQS